VYTMNVNTAFPDTSVASSTAYVGGSTRMTGIALPDKGSQYYVELENNGDDNSTGSGKIYHQ